MHLQHPLLPVSVPIHTEASVYPLPRAIFRMFGNDDLQDFDGVSLFHLALKYLHPSGLSIIRLAACQLMIPSTDTWLRRLFLIFPKLIQIVEKMVQYNWFCSASV